MNCPDFLAHYSDYRDGLLGDPAVEARVHVHLAVCPRCRRYDATIRRGVNILREARLTPRRPCGVAAPDGPPGTRPLPTGVGVVGVLAVLAAATFLLGRGSDEGAAPDVPRDVIPRAVANAGVPFVGFAVQEPRVPSDPDPDAPDPPPTGSPVTLYPPTPDR